MAPAGKEATVIIFDVGLNSKTGENETFFTKAKSCILKILQRKIFGKPKDEVALILMGTNNTNNHLNRTIGGYDYITEKFEFGITNWGMIRVIEQELSTENKTADWLDALIVAMNCIKIASETKKYSSFQIVLLTTFSTFVNAESVDYVIKGLQNFKIELVVISNNVNQREDDDNMGFFSQCLSKSHEQNNSEKLIEKMIEKTDGVLCSFEFAIVNLMYFPKKKVKGMPWNCALTLGTDIKINTSSYIMITEDKSIPSWKTESSYANSLTKLVTEYFLNEKKIDVDFDTLIKGYMYGSSVIPCGPDVNIKLKSTVKSFNCIGFTNEDSVLDEYLTGSGTSIVVPFKDCEISKKSFSSLIDAMIKLKKVMIARKVYRAECNPKLVVLFPMYQSNCPCFTLIELSFAENLVLFHFPLLRNKKCEPSTEQLDAIDKMIDSMDLMNANEENDGFKEAFAYKKTLNPSHQYVFRCIAQRSLKPKEPLAAPDKELLDMLEIPKKLKENCNKEIETVSKLFEFEQIQKPTFNYKFKSNSNDNNSADKVVDIDQSVLGRRNVLEIGTVTPAEDFAYLLNSGEKFSILCAQLQNVISDLVFKSLTKQDSKICEALFLYREESKILGAFNYNDWIVEFKKSILNRNKNDFWQDIIVKEKLGLISSKESDSTTITEEEVAQFYKNIILDIPNDNNNQDEDENVDDLFDM